MVLAAPPESQRAQLPLWLTSTTSQSSSTCREKAGQGEGLLVTTGRRVWVNLYGHTSPGEYAMANSDVLVDVEDDRRNGHAAATVALAAR
jgi:hypothetical protein